MDCSPPGSSVCGIFQARILEGVAIPFSKGSSQLRVRTWIFCISGELYLLNHQGSPKEALRNIKELVIGRFSCSAVSESLLPLQHARPPCPSPTPRACSKSCPLTWWCHPSISSSVVPFSSCLQSFPASGSFPMSQSSHQVAKILKFHLQHQSLQLIFRDDFT